MKPTGKDWLVGYLLACAKSAEEAAGHYEHAWASQGSAQIALGGVTEKLPQATSWPEGACAALADLRSAVASSVLFQVDMSEATRSGQVMEAKSLREIAKAARELADAILREGVLQ